MLGYLRVRNLGILADAQIEPGPGFTVVTGETGAGKTMLLGALRLLTGEKPKPGAVGPFSDETVSEGLFEDGEEELGVSRVVPRNGKSRAYLDGSLVSARTLTERTGRLVEIVAQHDQLSLRRSGSVLQMVDGALDEKGLDRRQAYDEAWTRHRAALDNQRRLGGDRMGLERELDLVRYQANEIQAAGLEPGDDNRMESLAARLRNIELIRDSLGLARERLGSMADDAGEVVAALRKVAAVDDSLDGPLSSAEAVVEVTQELDRSIREHLESMSDDPEALEQAERQLTSLGELKRKYGRTLEEVLDFGADAGRRAGELEALLEQASDIDRLIETSRVEVAAAADQLREARLTAISAIEEKAKDHLSALGLPSAALRFALEQTEPGPSGADRIDLLFASDDRLEAGAAQEVASGGELSRLVLSLRLATRSGDAATLVFDEVDAGVGGVTALALGRKLADLARGQQVLCVTHLPQVAAHAEVHYVIERSGETALVRRVEGEERLTELSRMLAGLPESERGREAAAELLEGART